MALKNGEKAPDFTLPTSTEESFSLAESMGKPLILYFYPKDFTAGCTRQACSFRDNFEVFRDLSIDIYGISTDSPAKHRDFRKKHNLPFELLSDEDGEVSRLYEAKMPFVNVSRRITYLLDKDHTILASFTSLFDADRHIREMVDQVNSGDFSHPSQNG